MTNNHDSTMNEGELELNNPLTLAWIAVVSLGGSLIAYQHVGTVTAWVVLIPTIAAAAGILRYAIPATVFVAKIAYQDTVGEIRRLFLGDRNSVEVER